MTLSPAKRGVLESRGPVLYRDTLARTGMHTDRVECQFVCLGEATNLFEDDKAPDERDVWEFDIGRRNFVPHSCEFYIRGGWGMGFDDRLAEELYVIGRLRLSLLYTVF